MAKSPKGSRSGSSRKSLDHESIAASQRSELSIDYDERPQNAPLEGPTGRWLATLPTGSTKELTSAIAAVSKSFSLNSVCNTKDFSGAMEVAQMDSADVIVFQEFNVAVIKSDPEQRVGVRDTAERQGMIVEPEFWNHPLGMISQRTPIENSLDRLAAEPRPESLDYLRGFRDGLSRAIDQAYLPTDTNRSSAGVASFGNSAAATWGLQATGAIGATRTGAGVRVAILDTGFDATHPDFSGRTVVSKTFIPPTVTDQFGNVITLTDISPTVDQSGHGTHCIGTSCGPKQPQSGPRYGVAHGAEIFNGKVMSVIPGFSRASGADAWILEGIRWAISNGCSIISMSLGSPVEAGDPTVDPVSAAYETVAAAAWENGVLIVAAAGNESDREGLYGPLFARFTKPVGRPANCPHIVAVAAVGPTTLSGNTLKIANFSNRHMVDQGGEINLCGPGVGVLSSFPQPRHQFLDGTSQATPHVAGIAALVQEETGKKGKDLYLELRNRVVPQGSRLDYGNGLVHV